MSHRSEDAVRPRRAFLLTAGATVATAATGIASAQPAYANGLDHGAMRMQNSATDSISDADFINHARDLENHLYATSYGVLADGSTDDTNAMQSALNAASAAGRVLVLPRGTIKITAGLIWKHGTHAIQGSAPGTTIDARAMTSGATITLTPPSYVDRTRSWLSDVQFIGPSAAGTTVDAITNDTSSDTTRMTITRCLFKGFRNQVNLADNSYLITFDHCGFTTPNAGPPVYLHGNNMGENIVFQNCVFWNTVEFPFIKTDTKAGLSLFLNKCSFDFGFQVIELHCGMVNFNQCHLEGRYPGPWITAAADGSRPTVLTFQGGQIMCQTKTGDTLTQHDIIHINPGAQQAPVTVAMHGTHVKDSAGPNGVRVLTDTSGFALNSFNMQPAISAGNGERVTIGNPTNLLRGGAFDALPALATAPPTTWNTDWGMSASSPNVQAAMSLDTTTVTKDGSASGCLKFAPLQFNGSRATILSKRFACQAKRPILISIEYDIQAFVSAAGSQDGINLLVSWYSADGSTIQAEYYDSTMLRGGVRSAAPRDIVWEFGSAQLLPPIGAASGQLRLIGQNASWNQLLIKNFFASQM